MLLMSGLREAPIGRTFTLAPPRPYIALPRPARGANSRSPRMPRFAANLAYLFTERPLIARFAAAAAAGFKAVELQFPYDHGPSAVKAELDRHGLTMLGINIAPGQHASARPGSGQAAGEFGVAAIP